MLLQTPSLRHQPGDGLMDDEPPQVKAPDWMVPGASSLGARRPPLLEDDEVHVWRAALDLQASQVPNLQRNLSEDERVRVRRFHFQKDRYRFIVARGLLRVILAHYLDAKPAQLRFCYGAHGKPRLALSEAEELHFSVSHSQGLALFAVTRGQQVGVDLEAIRPHPGNEDVAEQFFTLRETAILRALPPDARQEAFFAFWTRKEAYAKARGEGLTIPLNRFDVSFPSGHPATLVGAGGHPQEASLRSLRDVNPGAGFAAALAIEGPDLKLKCWEWS